MIYSSNFSSVLTCTYLNRDLNSELNAVNWTYIELNELYTTMDDTTLTGKQNFVLFTAVRRS